ncbi:hypothetical protein K8352_08790 [Flavobacteriaceae bacterium F89]|uniref:Membrane or secreted protein n=1 Tax=Cerina litoralis TaxID=2874477 RepID=A0AAE3JR19_9FLAO|nr:hypothetical protein [Cerina litoralis]MCG2460843.1 hypothetical protein [Cerina litoralis]
MTLINRNILLLSLVLIGSCYTIMAQLGPDVYKYEEKLGDNHMVYQFMINNQYAILSVYKTSPPEFVKTLGGFYKINNDTLEMQLEFNSNFGKDSLMQLRIPFAQTDRGIQFRLEGLKDFKATPKMKQDLDGEWLFAARTADLDKGRRDAKNPRKTLKFLLDGHFQWIAYNSDTFEFFGTGGGTFTSKNGRYRESIEFFSRDNSRVGQKLGFGYELRGNDWFHTGKSSKGDPLGEIWSKR